MMPESLAPGMSQLTPIFIQAVEAREKDRLEQIKLKLIERNHRLGGSPIGFMFAGRVFTNCRKPRPHELASLGFLDQSLRNEGNAWQEETRLVESELRRLRQSLDSVLAACKNLQDVRDMLPDTAKSIYDPLRSLDRTRPPGFLFEDSELRMSAFVTTEELIGFFAANRILY